MIKKILFLLFFPCILCADAPFSLSAAPEIVINNRILLKINGKPLTVVDVMKKMDLIFYRQYPHLLYSPQARMEFYKTNFFPFFSSLVNDLLIAADAEEKEVELSDGDVREELETIFGPQVVENIDKLKLSYQEAWDLVKRELIVRQMTQMMVRSKAMAEMQPKELKVLYDAYVKSHPAEKEWTYQVITLKGIEKELVESAGRRLLIDFVERRIAFHQISKQIKEELGVEISFSDEFVRKEKEISEVHKKALMGLTPMSMTLPIIQEEKNEGQCVARIFFLRELKENESSFKELEDKLHQEILQKAVAKQGEIYSEKLRERYGITPQYLMQMIPPHFEPFALR